MLIIIDKRIPLEAKLKLKTFGELLELIPYCDSVEKRHAFCKRCKIPTPALFTHSEKKSKDDQVEIGGEEMYEPLCRAHYLDCS